MAHAVDWFSRPEDAGEFFLGFLCVAGAQAEDRKSGYIIDSFTRQTRQAFEIGGNIGEVAIRVDFPSPVRGGFDKFAEALALKAGGILDRFLFYGEFGKNIAHALIVMRDHIGADHHHQGDHDEIDVASQDQYRRERQYAHEQREACRPRHGGERH